MIERICQVCNKRVGAVNEKQMQTNWYEHETMSIRHQNYLSLKLVSQSV